MLKGILITVSLSGTSEVSLGNSGVIASIPDGFKPQNSFSFLACDVKSNTPTPLLVEVDNENNTIKVNSPSISVGSRIRGAFTYIAK